MSVVIETTVGDITIDLFTEERPVACLNFLKLCKLKYYNYNLFHTIEQGFIAQTGDPVGKGDGGCSVWGLVEGSHKRFFEAESIPKIYHSSAGLISLVSAGKNLVGSQFFFTLGSNLTSLDGIHCVIGEVVEGQETLRKLNDAIVDDSFRPYQDIRITHTVVLDDPFPDPRGFQVPIRSPSPSAERLQNGRIAADEDIDDTDGKTMEEIQEMLAEREAKARATILEIVGDIPDADVAPPENVLFVCKLNPVTTDDDLEIIFSRFGKVKGCEVIRDKKTGDSLQYAFVEFEEQKACEAAYFKMDNVLIDDRRIHVDFSQSVAKVKWRGKGRGVEGSDGRLDFDNLREVKNIGYRRGKNNFPVRQQHDTTLEERRAQRERRHEEQKKRERKQDRRRDQRSRSRSRAGSRERTNYRRDRQPYQGHTNKDRLQDRRSDKRSRSRSRADSREGTNYGRDRQPYRLHPNKDRKIESSQDEKYGRRKYARSTSVEQSRRDSKGIRYHSKRTDERQKPEKERFTVSSSKEKCRKRKKEKHYTSDSSDTSNICSTSNGETSSTDSDSSTSSKDYKRKRKSSKTKRKKSKKQKKKRHRK